MPCIEIENLTHIYFQGTPLQHTALRDISLEVRRGEFVVLAGSSGSGKSTLVRHFNGLLLPTTGRLRVLGGDVRDRAHRRDLWRRVGLVFQFPERQIFSATVHEDISFGPRNAGLQGDALDKRVDWAAELVDLPREVLSADPAELSGGMRRRVAIAGVLAMQPEILVLDEPGAGLEPRARTRILERIKDLQRRHGTTVVLITHHLEDAVSYAHRVLLLKAGELIAGGEPGDVLTRVDLLREAGLEPPLAVELACCLAEAGVALPQTPLTLEHAARLLAPLLMARGGNRGGGPC